MKADYMNLAVALREGSYIMEGETTVGFRRPTIMELKASEAIETLVKCAAVTDDHWRAIADELNEYKGIGTVEHFRELVQAEREKRLKIIPAGKYKTCGTCQYFVRTEGKSYGICQKRKYVTGEGPDKKVTFFVPYQSRKACSKEYAPKEAETDVAE